MQAQNLIGWWPGVVLGNQLLDLSSSSRHLTVGSSVISIMGDYGHALYLPGPYNQVAATTGAGPLVISGLSNPSTNSMTISARVFLDDVSDGHIFRISLGNANSPEDFDLYVVNNNYGFVSGQGPTFPRVIQKWTCLTGVYNAANTTLSLYVDGILVASTTSAPPSFTPIYITFGKIFTNTGGIHGAFYDMRLYNAALDSSTIYQIYNNPANLAYSINKSYVFLSAQLSSASSRRCKALSGLSSINCP